MTKTKEPKVYVARKHFYCGHWSADPDYYEDMQTGHKYCKPCGENLVEGLSPSKVLASS